jgi:cytochrome c peroxidase
MSSKKSIALSAVLLAVTIVCGPWKRTAAQGPSSDPAGDAATKMLTEGRQTFRFDTFGDEDFWGGSLRLHEAIQGARFGGVGPGVSPKTALSVGLKVDADAVPAELVAQLKAGSVNLDDPATTVALLKLNAVVGLTGFFDGNSNHLKSVGIQCALCHSTVDNSFSAPGIPPGNVGRRLDGWANRDLNVGAIVALSPDLSAVTNLLGADQAAVLKVLGAWGPGKFDAELFLDGKGFRPDGKSAATLIPPAFGMAGVNLHTWTGWGSVTHWNAFVANLEMHGKGRFWDPRLNDAAQFPIAARNGFGNLNPTLSPDDDRITPKLPALHFYQLALPAPESPFKQQAFTKAPQRGDELFSGKAKCNNCHVEPLWTEPGWNMHTAAEVCVDDFQANRGPDKRYRTAPLGGLFTHQKGGFYHDGRFATLNDVVDHYNSCMNLGLTADEKNDLVAYLLTL